MCPRGLHLCYLCLVHFVNVLFRLSQLGFISIFYLARRFSNLFGNRAVRGTIIHLFDLCF